MNRHWRSLTILFFFTAQDANSDIRALLVQLANPETEWAAASRLQKLGTPAAAALAANLRQDGYVQGFHGNHSATMRALEKLGESAIPEIERMLPPASSSNPNDIRFLQTAIHALAAIGGESVPPILVRLGLTANDERVRETAFYGLILHRYSWEEKRPGRPWEVCLRYDIPRACPLNSETQRVEAALKPLLGSIRDRLALEPNERVRAAAARVLEEPIPEAAGANRTTEWKTLQTRRGEELIPQLVTAEPWQMNEWMTELAATDDPAVLPFMTAYFRHPRFDISRHRPNSAADGDGERRFVRLLLNLTSQGSLEARALLYECSDRIDLPVSITCSRMVALLDRQRGLERIHAGLGQSFKRYAAQTLVELGDARGIPAIIDLLAEDATREDGFRILRRYTQEDLPENAAAWQEWWRGAASTFAVNTKAARIDIDCCRR
jgi:hypothetical protein